MLQLAPPAGRALVNTAHAANYSRAEFREIPRLRRKRGTKVSNIARQARNMVNRRKSLASDQQAGFARIVSGFPTHVA
jgi:hypothetical protein